MPACFFGTLPKLHIYLYPAMSTMDWINLVISLASLGLGYLGSRGELDKIRRHRKLPKLIKDREFYKNLHASTDVQLAYLAESILVVCAIGGAGLILTSFDRLPPASPPGFSAAISWLVGGAIYLFSILRLGRYSRATTKYEKTMTQLDEEISKLQG